MCDGSTSSALEVKMQRKNSTMNFSNPHPSDREQRAEIDHNRTHKQCSATVLIQGPMPLTDHATVPRV
jgi:hypothetical protein